MKYLVFSVCSAVVLSFIWMPLVTHAYEGVCGLSGATVVYVNGIFSSDIKAEKDKDKLEKKYSKYFKQDDIRFDYALNPSHLSGIGDVAKSIIQAHSANGKVDDTDLTTILKTIHKNVHTQKMVLVGHSQGTFYTNAVYDYLISHGIPQDAVVVYNTATPASFVAGGGDYTTSGSDKLIQSVRAGLTVTGGTQPLSNNITFDITAQEAEGQFGGHSFSDVYLKYGDYRIAKGINDALNTLTAGAVPEYVSEGCFTPPGNVAYYVKKAALAMGDMATQTSAAVSKVALSGLNTPLAIQARSIVTVLQVIFGNSQNTAVDTISVSPLMSIEKEVRTPVVQQEIQAEPSPPNEPPPPPVDLSRIEAQLQEANALVAFLQLQLTLLAERREKECIANSKPGPWNNVGWVGDTPGCDDETPWIQKMFWAPIQGAGGEGTTTGGTTSGEDDDVGCGIIGCVPDFVPDAGPF